MPETNTSSFFLTPAAKRDKCKQEVPLFKASTYLAFVNLLIFSNSSTPLPTVETNLLFIHKLRDF